MCNHYSLKVVLQSTSKKTVKRENAQPPTITFLVSKFVFTGYGKPGLLLLKFSMTFFGIKYLLPHLIQSKLSSLSEY